MIDKSKLSAALRRRFKTPADALRALGLDESGALNEAGERGGIGGAHAAEIMDHLKGKLSAEEMSELSLLLDRLLGEATVQANAGDDELEHPEHVDLARFLRGTGLDEQHVRKAVDMLPRAGTKGGRAADRRPMARDSVIDMSDFNKEFGGEHLGPGPGSPADMAFDREPPRRSPVLIDREMADFDKEFGGSHLQY
jgi:hypothetical protein